MARLREYQHAVKLAQLRWLEMQIRGDISERHSSKAMVTMEDALALVFFDVDRAAR